MKLGRNTQTPENHSPRGLQCSSKTRPWAAGSRQRVGKGLKPNVLQLEDRRLLATFDVTSAADSGASGTLRWAVGQANAAETPSTIDIELGTSPETLTLSLGELELSNTSAETTISDGAGQGSVTISGGGASRVFELEDGVTATISGVTISNGSAFEGGGIYNEGSLSVDNCTLTGNRSTSYGGGIFTSGVNLNVSNCTIAGNTSGESGGGINSQGTTTVVSSTFYGNYAGYDGGAIDNFHSRFFVQVGDSILDGDSAESVGPEFQNAVASLGHNLVSEDDSSSGWISSDLTGTSTNPLDALLGTLGNYGGTIETMALLAGSPAIEAGAATDYAGTDTPITTDERGEPLDFPNPDIGAFQTQGFSITAVAGSTPQTTQVGDAFANPLAVTLSLAAPEIQVSGIVVTYTVTSATNGASAVLSSLTATSGANGVAEIDATADMTAGSYAVVASVGDGFTAQFALTNLPSMTFTGITAQSIPYGTTSVTVSGTLSNGLEAPTGENVAIKLNGVTQQAKIASDGDFSATFTDTAGFTVTSSPYTITYTYAGDATFGAVSTSSTLTVTSVPPTVVASASGGIYSGTPFIGTGSVYGLDGSGGSSLEGIGVLLTYYSGTYTTTAQLAGLTPLSAAPSNAGDYTVLATFPGSADYSSTSATANFTVTQAIPTVSVTDSSGAYTGLAFAATGTATGVDGLARVSLNGVNVSLEYYTGTYKSAAQLAGLTSLSSPPKTVGSYTVLANFPGSTNYTSGMALANFAITQATPQVSLVDAGGTYQDVAYPATAAVLGVTGRGSTSLEGVSVAMAYYSGTYSSASELIGLMPLAAAPVESGSYTVMASFAGSADYVSADALQTFTITQAIPAVTVADRGGVYSGAAFVAADSIAGVNGSASSSLEGVGLSLTFYSGTYTSTAQLAGLSPLSTAPVQAGPYTAAAAFAGSTDYTSTAALVNFSIAQATPQIAWGPLVPIVYGTPLGPAQLDAQANVAGSFAYMTATGTYLGAGSGQTLSAVFTPQDSTDFTTVPASTTITVEQATPTLGLSDPGGIYDGDPFPASVTITGSGDDNSPAVSLEGVRPLLTYYDGTGTSGTKLSSLAPSAAGTYAVVAGFAGSADYVAVSSTPVTFTISPDATTISLASSASASVFGQAITFAATVGSAGAPAGAVTFLENGIVLATVPLAGTGTATLTTPALAVGSHAITASYSGDADHKGAQSGSAPETVGPSSTAVVLTADPVRKKKRLKSEILKAQIEPISPGAGVPSGIVTFELITKKKHKHKTKIKTKVLGAAAVDGGTATYAFKPKAVLKKVITVVYSGDPDFTATMLTAPKLSKKGLL